jgi:hypothetical protein
MGDRTKKKKKRGALAGRNAFQLDVIPDGVQRQCQDSHSPPPRWMCHQSRRKEPRMYTELAPDLFMYTEGVARISCYCYYSQVWSATSNNTQGILYIYI